MNDGLRRMCEETVMAETGVLASRL